MDKRAKLDLRSTTHFVPKILPFPALVSLLVYKLVSFQMVETIAPAITCFNHSKSRPFKIRLFKRSDFEWHSDVSVQILTHYCT